LIDRASRGDKGAVPDRHGRNQCRVRSDERVLPDDRTVLAESVVVAGDDSRADVRVLADLRVPDVGEVGGLHFLPDNGVLQLDEIADLHAIRQPAAGPDVGPGPNIDTIRDLTL